MASETEICNSGLQRLGVKRISNLTEKSPNARACAFAYPLVRGRLLRRYLWNFAKRRAILAPDTDAPITGPAFQYTWPTDALRILPGRNDTDWSIEGRKILTDTGSVLEVRYIALVTDPNEYDDLFQQLFAAALALEVQMELKKSKTLKDRLELDVKSILSEARRVNAFEGPPVEFPVDDWIAARR